MLWTSSIFTHRIPGVAHDNDMPRLNGTLMQEACVVSLRYLFTSEGLIVILVDKHTIFCREKKIYVITIFSLHAFHEFFIVNANEESV